MLQKERKWSEPSSSGCFLEGENLSSKVQLEKEREGDQKKEEKRGGRERLRKRGMERTTEKEKE